ncbi:YoaK family protein [Actinomadura verrucosospora]
MLALLTIMTGLVDSVSFLELGNVFVANMTGNIIFLGLGLGGSGTEIMLAALSTGFFCAGAVVGGRVAFTRPVHRGRLLGAATAAQAVALAAAAVIVANLGHRSGSGRLATIAVLAVSMGWQYAIVRRLEVPDLRTVVVTTTLTALVGERGQHGAALARRGLSIGALLLGAAIGALLIRHVSVSTPLWCAAVLLVVVAVASFLAARRPDARNWA